MPGGPLKGATAPLRQKGLKRQDEGFGGYTLLATPGLGFGKNYGTLAQ